MDRHRLDLGTAYYRTKAVLCDVEKGVADTGSPALPCWPQHFQRERLLLGVREWRGLGRPGGIPRAGMCSGAGQGYEDLG